jgi:hypothetical protein
LREDCTAYTYGYKTRQPTAEEYEKFIEEYPDQAYGGVMEIKGHCNLLKVDLPEGKEEERG